MKPLFVRAALSAAAVLAFATAVSAGPAQALRPRRSALLGRPAALAPGQPTCVDAAMKPASCVVQYYGGRVISNVKTYAVAWTANVDSNTKNGIPSFLAAVTNSEVMDWLNEYNTDISIQTGGSQGLNGSQQHIGRGTYGGGFTITPSVSGTTVTDAQVSAELTAQIKAGHLPFPDANTMYMVYFPLGYIIKEANGDASCDKFCAYHSAVAAGTVVPEFYYGVFPDFSTGKCPQGCGNDSAFQNLCSATTHEMVEAITDAEVSLAGGNDKPLGWYDLNNGEVGDMCNALHDTINGLDGFPYTVQQNYSHLTGLCQTTHTAAQDFEVLLNPNHVALALGGTAVLPLTAATTAGAQDQLSLQVVSGLPSGVTATFDSASIQSNGTASLTLTVSQSAAAVRDAVVVIEATGASSSVVHSASVLVSVVAPPAVTLTQGPSNGATVSGTVTLSATGTAGTGATLQSVAITINGRAVGQSGISTASYAWDTTQTPNGTATIVATATDTDGGSATKTVTVTVDNDFTLAVAPATATATIGGTPATLTITTTLVGASEPVALTVSGLPIGVTAAFDSATVTSGSNAVLVLTAPAGTVAVPSATVTVTGTGSSATHSATTTLTVSAPGGGCSTTGAPGFLLSLVPAFLLFARRRRAADLA